jgi:hypothetical protein
MFYLVYCTIHVLEVYSMCTTWCTVHVFCDVLYKICGVQYCKFSIWCTVDILRGVLCMSHVVYCIEHVLAV